MELRKHLYPKTVLYVKFLIPTPGCLVLYLSSAVTDLMHSEYLMKLEHELILEPTVLVRGFMIWEIKQK